MKGWGENRYRIIDKVDGFELAIKFWMCVFGVIEV